jgi:hypothetical protein
MEWSVISWEGWFLPSDQIPSLAEFQTKTSSIPMYLVADVLLLERISAVWQQLLLNAEPKHKKYFSVSNQNKVTTENEGPRTYKLT